MAALRAARREAGAGATTFDCEYGYSTIGCEIAGARGTRMGRDECEVITFVGDGPYLNSALHSTVLAGHKVIVVPCDNGGYAIIHRLQVGQGGAPYNNMLKDVRPGYEPVDWIAHARALGCRAEEVAGVEELDGAFWEVGVPEATPGPEVAEARERMLEGKRAQRVGW